MWNECFEKINYLFFEAQLNKERYKEPFIQENFKWILGREIVKKVILQRMLVYENPMLYGIGVEVDDKYPMKIELWEKVE